MVIAALLGGLLAHVAPSQPDHWLLAGDICGVAPEPEPTGSPLDASESKHCPWCRVDSHAWMLPASPPIIQVLVEVIRVSPPRRVAPWRSFVHTPGFPRGPPLSPDLPLL